MTVSRALVIVPLSADWSPVMSSSSVVLPAPFGPTIAKRRPALIISPTSLNRCCAAWLFDTPARVTRLMGALHGTGARSLDAGQPESGTVQETHTVVGVRLLPDYRPSQSATRRAPDVSNRSLVAMPGTPAAFQAFSTAWAEGVESQMASTVGPAPERQAPAAPRS